MKWILFIVIGGPLLLLALTAWWVVAFGSVIAIAVVVVCEAINESRKRQMRLARARARAERKALQ